MTALGYQAGQANTEAVLGTTFVGYQAGLANTSGANTAVGSLALKTNTTGAQNTVVGGQALQLNTTGSNNVAVGGNALNSNTTASNNTAVGYQAGYSLTTGGSNVIMGYQAFDAATTAASSTVIGNRAGGAITTGNNNTIVGADAGAGLTTGNGNCFIGATGTYASGEAMTTGSKNSIFGSFNGNQGGLDIRTASNYIVLSDGDGNPRAFVNANGYLKATPTASNLVGGNTSSFHEITSATNQPTILIGNTAADFADWGIQLDITRNTTNNTFYAINYYNRGAAATRFRVADSGNVTNTNNSYGAISDVKLKENIADATPKLEDLCKVKVRTFNFKTDQNHKQIGVIAQELETVFPSMVDESPDKDEDGNDLGTSTKQVKYSVFVPMLIKAVQELKAEVDSLKAQLNK
jgi:hypothetical protein